MYLAEEKDALYGTRHQEAVKIFNALLAQESLADPIKQVQDILQKCFDIEDLQSEVTIVLYLVVFLHILLRCSRTLITAPKCDRIWEKGACHADIHSEM